MLRKTVLFLMIFVLFGGFVLIKDSSARPDTRIWAVAWADIPRVLAGFAAAENTDDSAVWDNSQTLAASGNSKTGAIRQQNYSRPESERTIEKSPHFLFLRVKLSN